MTHSDAGVLVTFPLSHFCEKARWALDHAGLDYREHGYPPALHKLAVARRGGSSAPLLAGERTLLESTDIVRFADAACAPGHELYPLETEARDDVDELIGRLDATLGPDVRLWFYCWALPVPQRLAEWGSCGLNPGRRQLLHVLAPRIARVMTDRMKISERAAAEAAARIDEQLRQVSARLADGRRYLGGERFGAADITFAALAGPAVCPPGYGGERLVLPPMPEELTDQILAWRATAAGELALRLYRDHR